MSAPEKHQIISELWQTISDPAKRPQGWEAFAAGNAIELPLAFGIVHGWVGEPSDEAQQSLERTWVGLCDHLAIDPHRGYSSLANAIEQSPRSDLKPAKKRDNAAPKSRSDVHRRELGNPRKSSDDVSSRGRRNPVHSSASSTAPTTGSFFVSDAAWSLIATEVTNSKPYVRVYRLQCRCGRLRAGVSLDDHIREGDHQIKRGHLRVLVDSQTMSRLNKSHLDVEKGNWIKRSSLRVVTPNRQWDCRCGDNWQPTASVASAALMLGIARRNFIIANEWSGGSDVGFSEDSSSGDDNSEVDFGFDFGG